MARDQQRCPSCRRPARWLSPVGARLLVARTRALLLTLWGVLQAVVMVLVGMTAVYYLSPLLLLFPFVALSTKPPASRGGKTVSHGKRRR